MRDHVFRWGYSFKSGVRVGKFPGKPLLQQRGDPWRTVAERFDLLVLDKDGVAANPIIAADRAV
jgi:hypothetical protein